MAPDRLPARYFPIDERPYRFHAGLHRFGRDFGNGEVDRQFFQLDDEAPRYRRAKLRVPPRRAGVLVRTAGQRAAHRAVLAWLQERLEREHPELARQLPRDLPSSLARDGPAQAYAALTRLVQEDLAVLHRAPREDEKAIAVYVDAPSGWRPERILGATFQQIHAPVPGFVESRGQADSMVSSMVERGPYVRFVWTITADDHLDHHPEEGRRRPWRREGPGWLRVERQVTVPFPPQGASLFLIRTYLYRFDRLTSTERGVLRRALAAMPDEVARYKAIDGPPREFALRLLAD